MMEDKRKSPRFERFYEVGYSPPKEEAAINITVSKNISRGGMCIPVLSELVRKGDTLKLDIKSYNEKGLVSAVGKVIWAKKIKREAPLDQEVGLEFVEIDLADLDRLIESAMD